MTSRTVGDPTVRRVVALLMAVTALSLSCWIVLPGPTYFFLTFSVGAPEISAWLLVLSAAALLLALADTRRRVITRLTIALALVAFGLAARPLAQFSPTRRRFDAAMVSALGRDAMEPRPTFARAGALSVTDLFRGIPTGPARMSRGVPVASPGGRALTVDVYQPVSAGLHPIIVQVYGGAWQRGAPASNANAAQWLATHGYVVFAIDYRHAPEFRWPAQLDDVRLALAWIRDHAADYGADTSRVVLTGRSAGAQLAMVAAYTPGPLPIAGVISYYGPVDLIDAWLHPPRPDPLRIREVEETLFGAPLDSLRTRYREASPIAYANDRRPATLLVYGRRDHIVERRYGERLRDTLTARGTPAVYLEIPWADHAFDEVFNGPSNQLSLYYTERFLAWAFAAATGRRD